MKQYSRILLFSVLVVLLVSSCSVLNLMTNVPRDFYPGILVKKDGSAQKAFILMPQAEDQTISISSQASGANATKISAEDIVYFQLHNAQAPQNEHRFYYLPRRGGNMVWMAFLDRGEHVSAYIMALTYKIEKDGSLGLIGYQQKTQHSNGTMMVEKPSYSLFFQKNGESTKFISLIGGVSFEGSSFRAGVVRYLSDDDELCRYVRELKWTFDDLDKIVRYYNPKRSGSLAVKDDNGNTLALPPRKLTTSILDKELVYTLSGSKAMAPNHGMGAKVGFRSSLGTYFVYGSEVGISTPAYTDENEILLNDRINWFRTGGDRTKYEVQKELIKQDKVFNFDVFAGLQLPLDFKKVYLIPSLSFTASGDLGMEFRGLSVGPLARLDLGIPVKYSDVFFIGVGYKHSYFLKSEEDRIKTTYKNLNTYAPLGTAYITIGYTF